MGNAFLYGNGGGGAGLNFTVRAYQSIDDLPETAKENTIAVITPEAISSWILSPMEPEVPESGMVWITTGTTGAVGFNVLKKNAVVVCPMLAKHYIYGAWVNVDAKIYQNGWNDMLSEVVFFGDGKINADIFGSTKVASGYNNYSISGANIVFTQYVDVTATKLLDVSAFNTIECVVHHWDYMHVDMYLVDSFGTQNKLNFISSDQTSGGKRTFDISGYSGKYYLRVVTGPGASNSVSYSSIKFKV